METVAKIRRRRLVAGETISGTARELWLSRNTVKKYLHQAEPPVIKADLAATTVGLDEEYEMRAIELTSSAHDGKVTLSIPEPYRHDWNNKPVRVILMVDDVPSTKPKGSLLSSLKAIQIDGPEDLSERHDAYCNGTVDA